jgi:hypothetical protein
MGMNQSRRSKGAQLFKLYSPINRDLARNPLGVIDARVSVKFRYWNQYT